jgi:ABC-type transport system substrate-binding protein
MVDKLQIQVYTDEVAEYNAMLQNPSQLDLGDWPVPVSDVSAFTTDSRFILSPPNSEFGMFEFDFNHANTFFGIPDNFGNNQQGIEFREAVAHLIDKPAVVNDLFIGLASPIDNAVPPAQGLLCSGLGCQSNPNGANSPAAYSYVDTANGKSVSLTGACGWETVPSLQTGCLSAFRQSADTLDPVGLVTASASNPDFCDAAQHLVNAGLATGINAVDCSVAGHHTAALDSGTIILSVRSDNPPRLAIGNDLATRLCELFDGTGLTTCSQISSIHMGILQVEQQVYNTKSILLDWHIYTGASSLTPIFDQLYALYNSAFASNACGGKNAIFGQDYSYFCNTQFDAYTSMLEFNDTTTGATASAQMAMQIFGQSVATVPLWSQGIRVPYLASLTGVNDASGFGPPQYFTTLNAWSSAPPLPGTLRWGFRQGTINLNIFLADSRWEFYVDREIYDSLISTAPYNATTPFAYLASSYSTVVADSTGKCGNGDLYPVAGSQSCLIFNLRPNTFWQDGRAVTGSDIKFSMLSYKKIPGPLSSGVSGLLDVTYQAGPSPGTNAVFTHLTSKSPFAIFNIGREPIIPQHVWASDPTTPCPGTQTGTTPPASCAVNPALISADPITSSVCSSTSTQSTNTVHPETACTAPGSTAVPPGGLCPTTSFTNRTGLFNLGGCKGLFVGSGPWVCTNLNLSGTPASEVLTGNGCTSTATNTFGTQLVDVGGTIILQRMGFGYPGYDTVHSYYRDSRFYKNWLWADRQGQGVVNFLDVSNFGSCWASGGTRLTISSTQNSGCLHWALPSATISTTLCGTAGWPTADCNAASATNLSLGGDSPNCANTGQSCFLDVIEASEIGTLYNVYWTNPVVYTQFLGAQPVPQTLYEGGIVYNGQAPP